jgi:hypothetical protein
MPSHFSSIGFDLGTQEDFESLANQLAGEAKRILVKGGEYLRWTGGAGEEVWMQLQSAEEALVGMNPHFAGSSTMRIMLERRVRRQDDSPLDGAFYAWAAPDDTDPADPGAPAGAYPFVFDSPDAHASRELALPGPALAQISAFAHEISCYDSEAAFESAQATQPLKYASRSFFPLGLLAADGSQSDAPEAHAMITGEVLQSKTRRNALTGVDFHWALVETHGGQFDVVIDRTLLPRAPTVGGLISGTFWLSGRLLEYPRRGRGWLSQIVASG